MQWRLAGVFHVVVVFQGLRAPDNLKIVSAFPFRTLKSVHSFLQCSQKIAGIKSLTPVL